MRAVENRRSVVRAANTGISCFIDPLGRVKSSVRKSGEEIFVRGVLTDTVDIIRSRSYYSLYGDRFAFFSAGMFALVMIVEFFLSAAGKKK